MRTEDYKEILIFVAGSTPQIITETIYALAQKNPPIIPHKFYFITTSVGKKLIKKTLLEKGILKELSKELGLLLPEIQNDSFIIAKNEEGIEIDDIRTKKENEIIGDLITSFIREQAQDPKNRLHCSLAGGRKTMSFYIGSALQLFGRAWDKLYHVLVSPEFESNPNFFYKPKKDILIECRMPDGSTKELNTKDAEISLVELPFIRLRDKIPFHKKGFKELVEEGQKEIDTATMQPHLKINLAERTITIGDIVIENISPMLLFIYTVFLRKKTDGCKHNSRIYCLDCTDCFDNVYEVLSKNVLQEFASDHKKIYEGRPSKTQEFLDRYKEGIPSEKIRSYMSKIRNKLKEKLDETLLPYYTISSIRQYGSSIYGVKVEKGKISIE
ncbi:MAG: CRISPR-associated ring nuclease Csm6 [Thermodesulfovibrionales bacterium]|nr:CRISPR-associated ring nuclease Csm6 [Thermodesulfovibrionales bacterium]